jgi:hypothetical protein
VVRLWRVAHRSVLCPFEAGRRTASRIVVLAASKCVVCDHYRNLRRRCEVPREGVKEGVIWPVYMCEGPGRYDDSVDRDPIQTQATHGTDAYLAQRITAQELCSVRWLSPADRIANRT